MSGTKHDVEKPDLSLLSTVWVLGVGRVLTFGKKKYTQFGECECHVSIAKTLRFKLEECAETITTNSLKHQIRSTQKNKKKARPSGTLNTKNTWRNTINDDMPNDIVAQNFEKREEFKIFCKRIKSTKRNFNLSSAEHAIFVEATKILGSTTTMRPESLGEDFVTRVTFILDGLKKESGFQRHSNTCGALRVVSTGAHNWRKGLEQSRLLAAALRHIFAYLAHEDNDPESGESHLDHASCCLMFARELRQSHPELDDRYRKASPSGNRVGEG